MKNKNKKVIYYSDPLNDDFANNITKSYQIKENFKYVKKNPLFRLGSFFLYHFVALPIFFFILKIKHHVKVVNKSALKKLKHTGYFVYTNHTQDFIDAFMNQTLLFPTKKGHIVASNDVYSLKGLRTIVNMLGCLPTPNSMPQAKRFYDAIEYYIKKHDKIVILPEAHVWPYYNSIRPFSDAGFMFPSALLKPIIATTVVYRQRKHSPNKRPYITLVVSNPIYPKPSAPIKENQKYLRDEAYKAMVKATQDYKSYAHIRYERKTDIF